MDISSLLILLFGGGTLAGILVAVFNGVRDWRTGSRTKVRDIMSDLVANADAQEARADRERKRAGTAESERDRWRALAARYAIQLIREGHEPIPPFGMDSPGEPPSQTTTEPPA